MIVEKVSEVSDSDLHRPRGIIANEVPTASGEPAASSANALIAVEQAIIAAVMIKVAAEAAERAVARAKETAEAAVNAAFAAAAEVVAEASAVAEARDIAAAAATVAAERIRVKSAAAIGAEVDSTVVLAQMTRTLSEELAARRESEARLRQRESQVTAFAGMIAHDLKAPLRAVAGFTVMLRSDLTDGADLDVPSLEKLDRILAATERMSHLVDDQLAFVTARERALDLQRVDLEAMIAEIITDLGLNLPGAVQSRAVIDVGPLPAVRADLMMCRQLLENLIGNALKYVRPGHPARIAISAGIEPGHLMPMETVHVKIADQGTGIPSGQHEKLFASFYRTHAEFPGTGLGLAICQRVIDRHGGTIRVTDNPGGGSVFHFTLPAASVPQAEVASGAVPAPSPEEV
jgi:signal transduction histidine kinase